jgi:hypothetical protein
MLKIPNHRRPRGIGNGSTGPQGDRVYAVAFDDVQAVGLTIRPDPKCPLVHAFIEPSAVVALSAYEASLVSTRPAWRQVWP